MGGAELLFLLLVLAVYAIPFVLVILISSAMRKTPIHNGFIGLGWAVLIFIAAAFVSTLLGQRDGGVIGWLAGGVITFFLAHRDGYQLRVQDWILLVLLGYWFIMWHRANWLWRRVSAQTP